MFVRRFNKLHFRVDVQYTSKYTAEVESCRKKNGSARLCIVLICVICFRLRICQMSLMVLYPEATYFQKHCTAFMIQIYPSS